MTKSLTMAAGLIVGGLLLAPGAASAGTIGLTAAPELGDAVTTVQYGYGGYGRGYGRGYGGGYGRRFYGGPRYGFGRPHYGHGYGRGFGYGRRGFY